MMKIYIFKVEIISYITLAASFKIRRAILVPGYCKFILYIYARKIFTVYL